jgi:hypothetical protein
MADSGLHMFLGQFTPRQIRVEKRYQDSTAAAVGAIIVYFHGPHRMTKDEVLSLRADLKKVLGILVEPLFAERASDPGDDLRAILVGSSRLPR